jgi:glutathione S-transferase
VLISPRVLILVSGSQPQQSRKAASVMKICYDPISTTSRPLMMFAAEHRVQIEWELVSLFQGEHKSPAFLAHNPNGTVPLLIDDGLVLSESAAILKYLAAKTQSPAYPQDLSERARVDSVIDWFMTNFHYALGSSLAYPTLYPAMKPLSTQAFNELTERAAADTRSAFKVLDEHMIGPNREYVAGEELTLADYVGSSVVVLAEAIDFNLRPFPNVIRWLGTMKARPSWQPTYAAFTGLITALRPAA